MSTLSRENKKFYIIVLITLAIMLGFGHLPTFAQITPDGMRILGIFLGCLFAWIFGEIVWSSILGVVLTCAYGFGTMAENFAAAYGNNVVSIMLTSIVFCYAIEKSGLLSEIARWIVGQRWAQKSPWLLIFAFFLASSVLAILVCNCVPPMILLWALYYELAKEIGAKPHDTLSNITICGIAVTATMGCCVMPYAGMATIVRGIAQQMDPAFAFNTAEYIIINLILMALLLPIFMIVLRLLFNKSVKAFKIPQREPYKMNLNQESVIAVTVLALIIIAMIFPNFLSSDNAIRILVNTKLTVSGLFMVGAVILAIIHVKGKPVLDIVSGLSNIPWPLFLLVSSALCMSDYLVADEMGIKGSLISLLNPLVEGKSVFAVTMIFMAIGLIMTNLINDVATIMILMPIASGFIVDAGGSIMLLAVLFGQATVQGCLMPSGSIIGAMMHGNTTWLKAKNIFLYVGIMEILVLIDLLLVTFVGYHIGI